MTKEKIIEVFKKYYGEMYPEYLNQFASELLSIIETEGKEDKKQIDQYIDLKSGCKKFLNEIGTLKEKYKNQKSEYTNNTKEENDANNWIIEGHRRSYIYIEDKFKNLLKWLSVID